MAEKMIWDADRPSKTRTVANAFAMLAMFAVVMALAACKTTGPPPVALPTHELGG